MRDAYAPLVLTASLVRRQGRREGESIIIRNCVSLTLRQPKPISYLFRVKTGEMADEVKAKIDEFK